MSFDHPIFIESIKYIRKNSDLSNFNQLEQKVVERLIHTSGDFSIQKLIKFSERSCENGINALKSGAPIFADTKMAISAIKPFIDRTTKNEVFCMLDYYFEEGFINKKTKTEIGFERGWTILSNNYQNKKSPIILIGSSPTALNKLLDTIDKTQVYPSLVIGMPVGFIGVESSKNRLLSSKCNFIMLESTRGGASMVSAALNALAREAY